MEPEKANRQAGDSGGQRPPAPPRGGKAFRSSKDKTRKKAPRPRRRSPGSDIDTEDTGPEEQASSEASECTEPGTRRPRAGARGPRLVKLPTTGSRLSRLAYMRRYNEHLDRRLSSLEHKQVGYTVKIGGFPDRSSLEDQEQALACLINEDTEMGALQTALRGAEKVKVPGYTVSGLRLKQPADLQQILDEVRSVPWIRRSMGHTLTVEEMQGLGDRMRSTAAKWLENMVDRVNRSHRGVPAYSYAHDPIHLVTWTRPAAARPADQEKRQPRTVVAFLKQFGYRVQLIAMREAADELLREHEKAWEAAQIVGEMWPEPIRLLYATQEELSEMLAAYRALTRGLNRRQQTWRGLRGGVPHKGPPRNATWHRRKQPGRHVQVQVSGQRQATGDSGGPGQGEPRTGD